MRAAVYARQGTSGEPQMVFLGAALALLLVGFGAYRLARRRTRLTGQPS
jgi:hypothetical protein